MLEAKKGKKEVIECDSKRMLEIKKNEKWKIERHSIDTKGTKKEGSKNTRYKDSTVSTQANRGGIQERTVGLRFLGIILRVLRLQVSTLVLCLSTRCSS
jgi:hypothetical protein